MPSRNANEAARCITCGGKHLEHHLEVPELNFSKRITRGSILRCSDCDTFVLEPFPDANDIRELYQVDQVFSIPDPPNPHAKKIFFRQLENLYRKYGDDRNFIVKNTLKRCGNKKNPRVLDVGCSTGPLLQRFRELSPQAELVGLDIDPGAKERAPEWLRDSIHIGPLEELNGVGKFDIITMRFVIEHLLNPEPALKKIHELLKPGGCVMISTPDIRSKKAMACGAKWTLITDPRWKIGHCIWYSEKSLTNLMERNGLNPVFVRNRGELFYDLPRPLRLGLERILGREPKSGRFIKLYQLRMLWAVLMDGFF